MSAREDARREWRERVNEAAREWGEQCRHFRDKQRNNGKGWSAFCRLIFRGMGLYSRIYHDPLGRLDDALRAPKPWRSSRKPDPRRRYSRSHRRACWRCRSVLRDPVCAGDGNIVYYARVSLLDARVMYPRLVRDPHGRRA